jgi:hypothetical protein
MTKCVSNKKMYPTMDVAEDALIEARTNFEFPSGHGPVGVYQCEDCGYFHLTSRGPVNEKLARHLADGKIKLQKEANKWLGKMKKR